MRCALISVTMLLAAPSLSAQSSFVRDGSIGVVAKDSQRVGVLPTIDIGDWAGMRFMFLPMTKGLREFGYGDFKPTLRYDQWVGKVVTVTSVGSGIVPEVTFRTEDGKTLKSVSHGGSVRDLAPLRDLEYARSELVGKTLWLRGTLLSTWDEATETSGSVNLLKYAPVHVEDVVASHDQTTPVRLVLRAPSGGIGFRDVNLSGTNIHMRLRQFGHFADLFLDADPRLARPWTKDVWDAIEREQVFVGMTDEQALLSWGEPNDRNTTATARGSEQQWVYSQNRYLYVSGGRVTAIQN